jgi:hypothetical protein
MMNNTKARLTLAFEVLRSGALPGRPRREVPPITPEEVAEAKAFFPLEKFFLFGHARSGTTLLARLLRLHSQVHCNWQAHFFTRPPLLEAFVADDEVGAWLSRRSNRWNSGRDLSPLVLRAAADFIMEREARQLGKSIVGDKSPSSLLHGESVRLLHKVYPDARLLYIIRDGRDTVLSHRFQAFVEWPERLPREERRIREDFASNPQPYLRGERSLFTEKAMRLAAAAWVQNVTETEQTGRELFGERYLSLRYEDLLAQPWREMLRLWAFLGATEPGADLQDAMTAELNQNLDAEWQQQKAGEIAGALQKGKRGSWREVFTERDKRLFDDIAGETLLLWGYRLE